MPGNSRQKSGKDKDPSKDQPKEKKDDPPKKLSPPRNKQGGEAMGDDPSEPSGSENSASDSTFSTTTETSTETDSSDSSEGETPVKIIMIGATDREEQAPGEVQEETSIIEIIDDAHAGTPMAVHRTLLIQVEEMTTVTTPREQITPSRVGVMTVDRQDAGHVLKRRDIIAEGNRDFLLMNRKTKAQIGQKTMASPMKLPTKTKSCNEFAR